jgi:hypothetical protein
MIINEHWIGKMWKEIVVALLRTCGTIPTSDWKDWVKPSKSSVRGAGLQIEVITPGPNKKLKC